MPAGTGKNCSIEALAKVMVSSRPKTSKAAPSVSPLASRMILLMSAPPDATSFIALPSFPLQRQPSSDA